MEQPAKHLSNSELGRVIGLTASAASYIRSGQRLPSHVVQRALVDQLGADWDTLNAALMKAQLGDRAEFAALMRQLTTVDAVAEKP